MLRSLATRAPRAYNRATQRNQCIQTRILSTGTQHYPCVPMRSIHRSRICQESENASKPSTANANTSPPPNDSLVMTPYEKVTATAQGGIWLGLIGLGAVGVYFVIRELLPNRMSPNGLFSETLDIVSSNTDVTSRIGLPVHGYGHDHGGHREGRRNRIEHVNLKDKDGKPRLRIKYNIKGPSGHAFVFAEVHDAMKKGEFAYLIVQFTKTGEVITIIDNRQLLAAESKEEQDALRQLLGQ